MNNFRFRSFTMRPGTSADREAVKSLVYTYLQHYGITPDPVRWEAHIENFGANPSSVHELILEKFGSIIGVGVLQTLSSSQGLISDLYLQSDSRNTGAGAVLYDSLIQLALDLKLETLRAETRTDFKAAVRLLEKAGWQRAADPVQVAGQVCPDRGYELELNIARRLKRPR